jgi:RNA polymerase sigma factor (sigma-70 family)
MDLLRRFRAGEVGAHREVSGWAKDVVRYRPFGVPRSEHDDIVQQSVAELWSACSRANFALRIGLRPLLRRIVLARCIDHLRRRRPNSELDPEMEAADLDGPLLDSDRWARVRWALRGIGERCRDIIRMHFLEDLSYAAIGEQMGIATATVRVHMFHCIREVRRRLDLDTSSGDS